MKAVPLLAITNAVTLALVILLYFQQDQPTSTQRAAAPRTQIDLEALKADVLASLKQHASELYRPSVPTESRDRVVMDDGKDGGPANATGSPGSDPGAADAGTDGAVPAKDAQMDTFRKSVRKAIALNRVEDQVNREVQRIDRLITANKIGAMSDTQKQAVASALLTSREKAPRIWRQFRNPEMRDLSRDDRAKLIRVEYQKLRDETQKELEETIPAADAKTILEEGMRGGDRGFRGFGGTGTSRRGR